MRFSSDKEAIFNHRLDGCDSMTLDLSIGCDHNCIYCHFSEFQKTLYRRVDREYNGTTIPLKIQRILDTPAAELPTKIYMSYSTDPFAPKVRELAHIVLQHLLKNKVQALIITKGIIPQKTLDLLSQYGDQVSVEIGLSNLNDKRNLLIEPGTPKALERLEVLKNLSRTHVSYVCARMDPLFPFIDDSEESIVPLFQAFEKAGVKNIVASYLVASDRMLERMSRLEMLKTSLEQITEKTPTVAPQPLLSVALDYKLEKYELFRKIATPLGMTLHTCHCKDGRLKKLDTHHNCHPGDTLAFQKNPRSESLKENPVYRAAGLSLGER